MLLKTMLLKGLLTMLIGMNFGKVFMLTLPLASPCLFLPISLNPIADGQAFLNRSMIAWLPKKAIGLLG